MYIDVGWNKLEKKAALHKSIHYFVLPQKKGGAHLETVAIVLVDEDRHGR